jgi:hypothetical protein
MTQWLVRGARRRTRRWGKRKARMFTVYLRALAPAARGAFTPRLAHGLAEARWVPLGEAPALPGLHPLVAQLLARHGAELQAAFGTAR